jgi:tRNA A-37 threonylcarbamoyl transferase component Bud32
VTVCNINLTDFENVLYKEGAGRNFTIDWYFDYQNCNNGVPILIEAVAIVSCEGIDDYSCKDNTHTRKCMYITPFVPNVPVESPINEGVPVSGMQPSTSEPKPPTRQPTLEPHGVTTTEDKKLTTFEKINIGISLGGWAFGALFLVLWIRLRSQVNRNQGYVQLTQREEPEKPMVVISKKDENKCFVDPQTKAEMLNIPPSELIIDKGKKLGSGQASDVFAGIWRQKPVAIKIPQDRTAEKKLIAELTVLREIDQHPNIVEIYGYFHYQKKLCVALELCDNQNLESKVKREDLSLADKFSIAMGIAAGVAHLHNATPGRQVIHRDLKPSNILLTKPGMQVIPKIADFDYSRLLVSQSAQTYSMPTIAYAAPESVGKEKKEFSVKSDSWAYGATLFFLLTKEQPFAPQASLTQKRQKNEVKVNFELLDKLPKDPFTKLLVDITVNCLENEPENRPNFDQICTRFQEFFNGFVPWNNNTNSVRNSNTL